MPGNAVRTIAQREGQGGNRSVNGRVMRISLTLFMSRNWVKRGSGENAQERGVVVSLKRICQAVRSMVSCTKGHVEKFLMNDDADDQFED